MLGVPHISGMLLREIRAGLPVKSVLSLVFKKEIPGDGIAIGADPKSKAATKSSACSSSVGSPALMHTPLV